MAKYETGGDYSERWTKNTVTGKVVTQWDRVTVGKSKNVWDVYEVFGDGMVRLQRQHAVNLSDPRAKHVVYRLMNMDQLNVVNEES